jgi:hypothetical protein
MADYYSAAAAGGKAKKPKRNKANSEGLQFIKGGKLNMLCLRVNKEVVKIDASTPAFLTNEAIIHGQGMDRIDFVPHVHFKVTLEFFEAYETVPGSMREAADWVLCSCPGNMASFNKTTQRLELRQCVVCMATSVAPLSTPFRMTLGFDEDEWVVLSCERP